MSNCPACGATAIITKQPETFGKSKVVNVRSDAVMMFATTVMHHIIQQSENGDGDKFTLYELYKFAQEHVKSHYGTDTIDPQHIFGDCIGQIDLCRIALN